MVWRCTQRARRNRLGTGHGERAGAHVKHAAHVRDAGRVEAQRLVERRRVAPGELPSRTEAHGGRHGGCKARGRVAAVSVLAACTEELTGHCGRGTRAGVRTLNM